MEKFNFAVKLLYFTLNVRASIFLFLIGCKINTVDLILQ